MHLLQPITHSVPVMTSNRRNLPPTIQRIDLGSSISSNASSLQSSTVQTPEDDDPLQYTHNGVSRKPSVTDTLFTRSDSALFIPTVQRRVVTVNKKRVTPVVEETSSSKKPTNNTADISSAINNNPSTLPLQVSQSTQDASVQVDLSSSSMLEQTTADDKSTQTVCIVVLNSPCCCRTCDTVNQYWTNNTSFYIITKHWSAGH